MRLRKILRLRVLVLVSLAVAMFVTSFMTGPVAGAPPPHASSILIADTGKKLLQYDFESGEITEFADLGDPFWDIRYTSPTEIGVIFPVSGADPRSTFSLYNLRTDELTHVVDVWGAIVGFTFDPRRGGTVYFGEGTESSGQILSYAMKSGSLEVLTVLPGSAGSPDGIVTDRRGRVVFTAGNAIYRLSPRTGDVEQIVTIPSGGLNGLVVEPAGTYVVTDIGRRGVHRVDPDSGSFDTLFEDPPFQAPEDVAIDFGGDIYVVDSDFIRHYAPDGGPWQSSIYVLRGGSEPLEWLVDCPKEDFECDTVDILLTPFNGPMDR